MRMSGRMEGKGCWANAGQMQRVRWGDAGRMIVSDEMMMGMLGSLMDRS